MQEAKLIYKDYTQKSELRLPQFPTAKYELNVESKKIEVEEDPEEGLEDLEENPDLEGNPDEVDKESNLHSD
ncbi:hypothetical protein PVK06_040265 [Gossypium arboreum]|uniref:Uncharacterized protein n=1 Tax=Gossypium arboreum TaxID=29729 RepID=A0ABR0N508_GOSAR|nr:hypothetical protein PVK06_040265 [Gossypium arboreum]